jgi:hypothetical protein
MRAIATANDTPKPQSALVLAFCILALLGAEIYWLYGWHSANEELLFANNRRSAANALDSRKIAELKAASVRINGLYLRFQEPPPSTPSAQFPLSSVAGLRQTEPVVIQDFVKAGFVAVPSGAMLTDTSSYELGSTRLEFHRLVPLIAQAENSNPFLFLDHVQLFRPKSAEPFSMKATALEARFTARIFTAATATR